MLSGVFIMSGFFIIMLRLRIIMRCRRRIRWRRIMRCFFIMADDFIWPLDMLLFMLLFWALAPAAVKAMHASKAIMTSALRLILCIGSSIRVVAL